MNNCLAAGSFYGRLCAGLIAALMPAAAAHAQEAWMLLSRESGCVSLQMLVRMERLPQAPSSPEEFAAMMRARGHQVAVTLPDGFPKEMAGKAVMVKYAENRAPVFLREELCRRADKP
jgi:hypothetical protein